MPCNITPNVLNDSTRLVLWYKVKLSRTASRKSRNYHNLAGVDQRRTDLFGRLAKLSAYFRFVINALPFVIVT